MCVCVARSAARAVIVIDKKVSFFHEPLVIFLLVARVLWCRPLVFLQEMLILGTRRFLF